MKVDVKKVRRVAGKIRKQMKEDPKFRAKFKKDPKAVLDEHGLNVAEMGFGHFTASRHTGSTTLCNNLWTSLA